jgi:hypothetical protein
MTLTKSQTLRLLAMLLAVAGAAALAGNALVPVPVPSGYGVRPTHSSLPVIYTESSGELQNLVDRKAIEAQCSVMKKMGATDKTPVFEDGDDKPLKTQSRRFGDDRHWAIYSVLHEYVCDRPWGKPSSSTEALCDCTYRVKPHYTAQIKNKLDGRIEIIDIDIAKQAARRRVMPDHSVPKPEQDAANVLKLAPEVVGKDVVAGIPCVVRRQSMGGKSHMDICVSEDPDKHLPPELRFRTLSEYMPAADGKGAHRWSKADKVLMDASVDSGVFRMPDGVTVKELK